MVYTTTIHCYGVQILFVIVGGPTLVQSLHGLLW